MVWWATVAAEATKDTQVARATQDTQVVEAEQDLRAAKVLEGSQVIQVI